MAPPDPNSIPFSNLRQASVIPDLVQPVEIQQIMRTIFGVSSCSSKSFLPWEDCIYLPILNLQKKLTIHV